MSSSRRVRHPILRLEVLAEDGTSTTAHRVFCRRKRSSVDLEQCARCCHCDEIQSGPTPSVHCTIPLREADIAPDPEGRRFEVGALLEAGAIVVRVLETFPVVVHEATPVRTALHLLAARHRREVTVVRQDGTALGLFRDVDGLRWLARARAGAVDGAICVQAQPLRPPSDVSAVDAEKDVAAAPACELQNLPAGERR